MKRSVSSPGSSRLSQSTSVSCSRVVDTVSVRMVVRNDGADMRVNISRCFLDRGNTTPTLSSAPSSSAMFS